LDLLFERNDATFGIHKIINPFRNLLKYGRFIGRKILFQVIFSTKANFVSIPVPLCLPARFDELLSEEEKIKALKYKFAKDRSRYVISHGVLRLILAEYTGHDPCEIRYEYTRHGKPYLANVTADRVIHFSMSHTKEICCYLVSCKDEVGIDIEKVNDELNWYNIAKLYFSPAELLFLESVSSENQVRAFFYLWTRKEANLKALGVGLSGLEQCEESLLSSHFNIQHVLVSFELEGNFLCSLAIRSNLLHIKFFHYDYLQCLEACQ
jgi:4'-phosphopantetheinyl transferase